MHEKSDILLDNYRHDRLPDRRDTGDRAKLRAEIDAYVARLYGLSLDDFSYILATFPVLKRKEGLRGIHVQEKMSGRV